MSSAKLSLYENVHAPRAAAAGLPPLHGGALALLSASGGEGWLRRRGAAASVLLHGAAVVAAWTLSAEKAPAPPAPPVVELIRLQPEPLKPPEPPLAPPKPAEPKLLAAARPVAQPLPLPKTVAAPAERAETTTPPEAPQQAAPPGPVTPQPPAPPAPPAPPPPQPPTQRQVSTEGIPTDYVNQVFARINSNADYPREAKMRRQQGKVGYRLTLSPQGAVLGVEIQGSGVEALDEAAREAIRRAAPFPRLPDLGGSSYLLAGNIVFKIN
jgi:protein TonB